MPKRRQRTPEEIEQKKLIDGFLENAKVENPEDLQKLIKAMMKQVVESSLEGELDEELGYTRYDYRNKETENSRNGY